MTKRVIPPLCIGLVAALAVGPACSSDDDAVDPGLPAVTSSVPSTDPPTADHDTSPDDEPGLGSILTPGPTTHLGATWFSPPPTAAQDRILELWEEVEAASSVGRVLIDWTDVEPAAGDRHFDELDESLGEIVASGRSPMVTLAAVDVSGTEFPEWLGEFEPDAAAAAYASMIEDLLPVLRRHEVWLLAIANEPPLADGEDLARPDFATFVEGVTRRLDDIAPDLPVTFTFAGGDPFIDDPAIQRMIDAVDAFSVNHYCLEQDLRTAPSTATTARIDEVVKRAGDLPVVFQEFGCPASESMGSSDEFQRDWFETAFAHIGSLERVRAAFVFEFLDWSPDTFDLDYGDSVDELESLLGPDFVERFRSWLLTSGLVRIDGTPRPAFELFIDVASA